MLFVFNLKAFHQFMTLVYILNHMALPTRSSFVKSSLKTSQVLTFHAYHMTTNFQKMDQRQIQSVMACRFMSG